MIRPIRFYVWHSAKKEWVHGPGPCGGCNILGETILLGEWCRVPIEELNDLVVLQSTGLTLRDGYEVYEGDILNTKAARWEVVFERGAFVAKWLMGAVGDENTRQILWSMMDDAIYLGNRHEKPELAESIA